MPDARLAPLPDTPRITVFTTVYNQEAFVADAIESVLAQDWPADRLQYVVVDDGSTDASPEIIAAYAERTPHMRWHRHENRGVIATFNVAMSHMDGDLIAFCSGDDMMAPGKLRAQAEHLIAHPHLGLSYSDMEVIGPDGAVLAPSFTAATGLVPHVGRPVGKLMVGNFVSFGGMMLRGALKPVFHPIPPHAGWEDHWWAWSVARVADIDYLDRVTYRYRQHGDNIALGADGPRLLAAQRVELPWRRWMLTDITDDEATPRDMLAAVAMLRLLIGQMCAQAGEPAPVIAPVSTEDAARADALLAEATTLAGADPQAAAYPCARALALDPHRPELLALARTLHGVLAPAPPPRRRIPGIGEIGSLMVLADADELVARPHLLHTYRDELAGSDDATLVIHAAGWTAERVGGELLAALAAAGMDGDAAPDMVAHIAPAGERPMLLSHAGAMLTATAATAGGVPVIDGTRPGALRALTATGTAGR